MGRQGPEKKMLLTTAQPSYPAGTHGKPKLQDSRLQLIKNRMQSDLRLAVVTLFSLCALFIIGPFAFYRFSVGDWLIGTADLIVVIIFLTLAILAWNPRWTRTAANLTAILGSLACATIVLFLGVSTMWIFAALVGNFLMADRRTALAVGIVMVGSIAFVPQTFADRAEHVTFIAVAFMISLYSLIFATRVDSQHGRLNEMASRDGLTDAYNRRSLDLDLRTLVDDPKAGTRSHCLVIMDLDNFKVLNDRHGHEAGDEILIRLTQIVCNQTRKKDRFYRYGGEEFVLLLPDTTMPGARIALANLYNSLASELAGPDGRATISFGLAQLQPSESAEDWLGRADKALFKAKRNGRDRIEEA